MWRSLVARVVRDDEAAGSNPVTPTQQRGFADRRSPFHCRRRRMSIPRLVAFDLDDTLAPSKSAIDPRIGELLIALAERVEVAIISGGQIGQFRAQVIDRLPDAPAETLERIHLMPTCGTQYFRYDGTRLHAGLRAPPHARTRRPAPSPPSRRRPVASASGPSRPGGRSSRTAARRSRSRRSARPHPSTRRPPGTRPAPRSRRCATPSPRASRTSRCARAGRRRSTSPTAASTRRTA